MGLKLGLGLGVRAGPWLSSVLSRELKCYRNRVSHKDHEKAVFEKRIIVLQ